MPLFFSYRSVWLAPLLLSGCFGDVDHENPLDPLSGAYDPVGTVSLTVTQFYPPFEGLADVEVRFYRIVDGANRKLVRIENTDNIGVLVAEELEKGTRTSRRVCDCD